MLKEALLAMLCIFICYAGSYITGSSMMDRPIVVGAVMGLFLGDLKTGLVIGATLEAVFMGAVNVGGVISSEPAIATVLAVTFSVLTNITEKAAVTLTVPIGILAAFVLLFLKNGVMAVFAPILDKMAEKNNQKGIVFLHFFTWFVYYGVYSFMAFLGVMLGTKPIQSLVDNIPKMLMSGLEAAGGLLPAVGFAILMKMLWDNKLAIFYLLGFVLTMYLELPAIAIACIGIVIVVVTSFRDHDLMNMNPNTVSAAENNDSTLSMQEQEEEDFFE